MPDGAIADRLLVTVLFSRTLPLIRYELNDSVRLATTGCDCGLPFRLLASIEGRTEETLTMLDDAGRPVRVHPNVFHTALDDVAARGWQIEQTPTGVVVAVVDPSGTLDLAGVASRVRSGLARIGAAGAIDVRRVDQVKRTTLGKAPLVRAMPAERSRQTRATVAWPGRGLDGTLTTRSSEANPA